MKILDGFVIFFGIWTLVANLMNLLHQSLFMTVTITAVLCSLLLFYWIIQRPITPNQPDDNSQITPLPSIISLGRLRRHHLILFALSVSLITLLTQSLVPYWLGGLILFPSVILFEFFNKNDHSSDINKNNLLVRFNSKQEWLWLIILCSIAIITILIVHNNDSDDSYYFNRSAVLAESPFEPMPDYWTLFPPEMSIEFPYPSWPLIAYHDFTGALSWLLNIEIFPVVAFVIAPSLAMFMVLAYGALFKAIAPRSWMWLLLILIGILISGGTSTRFVTIFGIPRLWQGKSILLHVMIPFVYLYGIRFGASGRWRDFGLLACAQIAMFGFSSMAVWLAPIVAGTAVLTGVIVYKPSQFLKRLIYAVGSSFYPLLIGIIVYTTSQEAVGDVKPTIVDIIPILEVPFGSIPSQLFWAVIILTSVVLIPHKIIRILIAVSAFFLSTIFANPFFVQYVAKYITSEPIYWRIFWMLPILIALTGIISLPIEYSQTWELSGKKRIGAFILTLCLLVGYNGYIIDYPILSIFPSNPSYYSIRRPRLKVPMQAYAVATSLVETLPEGSRISADTDISWVVPMFRKQIYPITPRKNVLRHVFKVHSENDAEYQFRFYLLRYATGQVPYDEQQWTKAVERWQLDAIVVVNTATDIDKLRSFLSSQGYTEQYINKYIIFGKNLGDLSQE
jgi:hypothetical protein